MRRKPPVSRRIAEDTPEGGNAAPTSSLEVGTGDNNDWRDLLASIDWRAVRPELGLSLREFQVVQRILAGQKLSVIARDMHLALGTVKTYCQRIHHKLGVTDQRELTLAVMNAHLSLEQLSRARRCAELPASGPA